MMEVTNLEVKILTNWAFPCIRKSIYKAFILPITQVDIKSDSGDKKSPHKASRITSAAQNAENEEICCGKSSQTIYHFMRASDGDGELTMYGISGLLAVNERVWSRNGAKKQWTDG